MIKKAMMSMPVRSAGAVSVMKSEKPTAGRSAALTTGLYEGWASSQAAA
jgi:hypothetical protein